MINYSLREHHKYFRMKKKLIVFFCGIFFSELLQLGQLIRLPNNPDMQWHRHPLQLIVLNGRDMIRLPTHKVPMRVCMSQANPIKINK